MRANICLKCPADAKAQVLPADGLQGRLQAAERGKVWDYLSTSMI